MNRHPHRALTLKLTLELPVPGVAYAVQRGKDDIEQVQSSTGADLLFVIEVLVLAKNSGLDFGGPNVQGPLGKRFIYITSGVRAGQSGSCWDRRAKVPLPTLEGSANDALVGRMAGTAKDGGPACASIQLLDAGWLPVSGSD